jgi:hypothetical protein
MTTGVILCFGLPTLFGLPSSLLPGEIFTNLLYGVVIGAPLGYCVSQFADSTLGGAAIGCGIGIFYCIVTMALAGGPVTVGAVLLGIGTGILPAPLWACMSVLIGEAAWLWWPNCMRADYRHERHDV